MFNHDIDDEEVEKVIRKFFTPEEWENLADILKIRYRNMYRNYISIAGAGIAEMVMPLPDFMRSKENRKLDDGANKKTSKKSKSKPKTLKRSNPDNAARQNPKRNVSKVNYYEPEEPKDDRYIFCDNCNEEYLDFCTKCGMLVSLKDYPVAIGTEDRAKKTIPKDILEIRPSPIHGFGVFTLRNLRRGIQMGPYQGEITRVNTTNGYSWKLRDGRLIDAGDETNSNWMRYVNCARNVAEQNTVAFQYKGNLYYRTCKEIRKGEELLVYYGRNFAKILGIDTRKYFQPDEEELNLKYFSCEFCFLGLSTREFRNSHQKLCKFRPNRMVVYSDEDFTCQYCHCSLTSVEFLKKHEKYCRQKYKGKGRPRSVVERKYHQCRYCEYKGAWKNTLNRHVIAIHERQKCMKFRCGKCEFETVHKTSVYKHMKTHEKSAAFKCTDCPNRGFNTKSHFDGHLLSHHPLLHHLITSKVHRCQICVYKTVRKTHLKGHMRHRHFDGRSKKHQCAHCNYSTVNKSHLTSHLRIHTNSRPFICRECDKGHNEKRLLDYHVLRKHPLNATLLGMITSKIHSCHFCTFRTVIKTHFTSHVRTHNK